MDSNIFGKGRLVYPPCGSVSPILPFGDKLHACNQVVQGLAAMGSFSKEKARGQSTGKKGVYRKDGIIKSELGIVKEKYFERKLGRRIHTCCSENLAC